MKTFKFGKFAILFCLFMLFYAGITYFNVDRSIYSIHQYPKLYVFLLIYAIINSFLWAFQNSFHSKEKEKALKIGFATNKFTYIEKGHKKFNKYYFGNSINTGLVFSFILISLNINVTNICDMVCSFFFGLGTGIVIHWILFRTIHQIADRRDLNKT